MTVIRLVRFLGVALLVGSLAASSTPADAQGSAGNASAAQSLGTARVGLAHWTPPVFTGSRFSSGLPSGGPLGVKVARVARHPGYDRVVIELAGRTPGKPGWRVEYVRTPTSDGSGHPVAVRGRFFLLVAVTGVGYPPDTGVRSPIVRRLRPTGTPIVREVVLDNVFEGVYTSYVGVSAKRNFRVLRLSNPARIVVDIRHR